VNLFGLRAQPRNPKDSCLSSLGSEDSASLRASLAASADLLRDGLGIEDVLPLAAARLSAASS